MSTPAYLTLIVALIAIIGTNLASFKDNLKNKYFITIIGIVMVIGGIISYIYFFNNAEKPIVWKDKAFEKMVQKALNKEGEYIYPKQLENITSLCIVSDRVAYIDKRKDELDFLISISSSRGDYCKFKLAEEEVYTIYYNRGDIVYLDDIKYFKELKELYVISNKIEDMPPLNSCTKLEHLRLDLNEIQNIQVFDSFKNLQSLYLASNRIKDISPLQSDILGNLESLSLQLNEIIDISSIGNLASRNKITYLNLAHNRIFELPNFEEYEALNSLYLDSNYIDNIENLSKLKAISTLYLYNNKIRNIEALENLNTLKNISLDFNNIESIDCIKNLDLNTLSIQNNRLKNFPNDFKNKNCTLDITDNFIQSKSSLKDFRNLKSDFQLFDIDVTPDNKTNPTKLNVTVDSLHELNNVNYLWDNSTSTPNTIQQKQFEVKVPSSEGKHNFYIMAQDKFGNKTKGSTSFSDTEGNVWIKFSYTVE